MWPFAAATPQSRTIRRNERLMVGGTLAGSPHIYTQRRPGSWALSPQPPATSDCVLMLKPYVQAFLHCKRHTLALHVCCRLRAPCILFNPQKSAFVDADADTADAACCELGRLCRLLCCRCRYCHRPEGTGSPARGGQRQPRGCAGCEQLLHPLLLPPCRCRLALRCRPERVAVAALR
jgi:hypothetical protein